MVQKTLELSDAAKKAEMVEKLAEYERRESQLAHENQVYKLALAQKANEEDLKNKAAIAAMKRAESAAETQAKADMQGILDAIHNAQLARDRANDDEKIATERQLAELEKQKNEAYAATVAKIMEAIQPGLIEALSAQVNANLANGIGQAVAPYAIAKGESTAEVVNTLLRGTAMEEVLKNIGANKQ
jgi:hypothetical protein